MIDGQDYFDQLIRNDLTTYDNIPKIATNLTIISGGEGGGGEGGGCNFQSVMMSITCLYFHAALQNFYLSFVVLIQVLIEIF